MVSSGRGFFIPLQWDGISWRKSEEPFDEKTIVARQDFESVFYYMRWDFGLPGVE